MQDFLPISKQDLTSRGWSELDIILVSGDAYVDHPSYGVSVIGRVLETAGYKVGIIAQPGWKGIDDFKRLGRPRLFFGVTSGNLDSMVANYTANKRPRDDDDYSPGGKALLRPDRALIVYSNKIREAFPGAAIVIGGIEASLRRLAHYDYWDNDVRRSVLLDSKADILVYGMGERQVVEIADRMRGGENIKSLDNIKGTVIARTDIAGFEDCVSIPSFEEVKADKDKFNEAFAGIYLEGDPFRGKTVIQKHQDRFAVQLPPALPLTTEEFDKIAKLPYKRAWHPVYDNQGGVPGFEMVKFSVISSRGCCGECSFCSLYFHQGRIVQSRSPASILNEIEIIAGRKDFKGTISDIGGPTANLYKAQCLLWAAKGACKNKKCLSPAVCDNLKLDYKGAAELLKKARRIPKVKHVFIGSGLRYDLLLDKCSDDYLALLCKYHVSGQLKVAPEHVSPEVLRLMNKPQIKVYEKFAERFYSASKAEGKEQYIVNYLISAHPGATLKDALALALYLMKKGIHPEQVQDFIPLPLTTSACMYYTERDPFTGARIYVAKTFKERKMQRALIQYKNPRNKKLVIEALAQLNRPDLKYSFLNTRMPK